ncbi:unnamed protein product [Rhizophagus irregularis]|nr:unnamed protein product [Rhizophagus irregularis]
MNGNDINDHILSRVTDENYAIFNDHIYGPSFGCADLILRGDNGHCIKDSYEKKIRGPSSESVLHYSIRCDGCNYAIRGMRWKCTSCEGYDLCQDCKPKSHIHRHPNDHVFELMTHSEFSYIAPLLAMHNGIVCKCCDETILGMRWKCTFCNYDLCQDCKSKSPDIHGNHPNNHTFQPIAYPGDNNRESEKIPTICDYCESTYCFAECLKCANGEFSVEEYEIFYVLKR